MTPTYFKMSVQDSFR